MKLTLEYDEVVKMLEQQLGQDISSEDLNITADPFSIEICNLNLDQIIQIKKGCKLSPVVPAESIPSLEPEAEKPMSEVNGVKEIANMLGQSQELTQTGGGAGIVPENPAEVPADFLPAGATYDQPGEMSQDEIRSRNR